MSEATTLKRPTATAIERALANPALPFDDEKAWNELLAEIRAYAASLPKSAETEEERETLRSETHRIRLLKKPIDEAGKAMTEEWRKKTAAVNAKRKDIVETLDALVTETRRPLTVFEEAEKQREAEREAVTGRLHTLADIPYGISPADLEKRLQEARSLTISDNLFEGAKRLQAEGTRARTIEVLEHALERARREAAEQAELEELRREKARREAEAASASTSEPARSPASADEPASAPAEASTPQAQPGPDPLLTETARSLMAACPSLQTSQALRIAGAIRDGRITHARWED